MRLKWYASSTDFPWQSAESLMRRRNARGNHSGGTCRRAKEGTHYWQNSRGSIHTIYLHAHEETGYLYSQLQNISLLLQRRRFCWRLRAKVHCSPLGLGSCWTGPVLNWCVTRLPSTSIQQKDLAANVALLPAQVVLKPQCVPHTLARIWEVELKSTGPRRLPSTTNGGEAREQISSAHIKRLIPG